jgi:hypothetical protein
MNKTISITNPNGNVVLASSAFDAKNNRTTQPLYSGKFLTAYRT